MLWQSHPQAAEHFLEQSQTDARERYRHYEQLAALPWREPQQLDSENRKEK
jgi:pyruvate-ferredoxin/flavodoxin oxidoreductase